MRPSNNNTLLSKINQNVETTNIFSPGPTDNISEINLRKQASIRIIQKIAKQNSEIHQQLKNINKEMVKTATLGDYLMAENQQLRDHYNRRAQDFGQLLKTIQINVHQNTNDVSQQIHLLKAANQSIYKNIKHYDQQLEQCSENTSKLNAKLVSNTHTKLADQLQIYNGMRARLQNKLNTKNMKQLTTEQERLARSEKKLLQEIMGLTLEVERLWKDNAQKDRERNVGSYGNMTDKDKYHMSIIETLKSIKMLQKEKQELQSNLQKINSYKYQLQISSQKLIQQFKQVYREREQKTQQYSTYLMDRANHHSNIESHKIHMSEYQIQRLNLSQNLQQVSNKLKTRTRQIAQLKNSQAAKIQEVEQNYNKKINQIKQKIRETHKTTDKELEVIGQEIQDAGRTLANLNNQYDMLENDCEDYIKMVANMDNPVHEIQRAQLILNIKKNKPILTNLINRL